MDHTFNIDGVEIKYVSDLKFDEIVSEDIKPARNYNLMLLNSDYVDGECVFQCLQEVFGLDAGAAQALTMAAHTHGSAVIGSSSKDIAETKMALAFDKIKELHAEKDRDEPSFIFEVVPVE